MWIFYAALSALGAAGVAIFAKVGLKGADATLAATARAVLMAIILIIVVAISRNGRWFSISEFTGREWKYIFLAALAGAMSWLFYFLALKTGTAIHVAAIDRASIVLVVFFAAMFLGESFTWQTALGSLFILAGAWLLIK